MRIKLIQPKMSLRPMDTVLKSRMAPSLGLLTLATLTPPEHDVVLADENVRALDLDDGRGRVSKSFRRVKFRCEGRKVTFVTVSDPPPSLATTLRAAIAETVSEQPV